jgi:phenylacetate-CoA ligase
MFYAGNLYASFLLHVLSVMAMPVPVVHVPIGGLNEIPEAVQLVKNTDSTVLLTTATSLVKIANHLTSHGETIDRIRCVLFGGEPLFPEQEKAIRLAFPGATSVKSCIYGSIDAGVLAMAAPGNDSRLHQGFNDTVVLEIVQNDGSSSPAVINRNGEPGMLIATNTLRHLCPVIRYPTGDRAAWVDKEKGLFHLLGRAGQAVRIGPVSVDVTDLRTVVDTVCASADIVVQGLQAVVSRIDSADQLQCMIATTPTTIADLALQQTTADAIATELYQQRPMFKQHVEHELIAPLLVRFVYFEELHLAKGSQKVLSVVDTRFDQPSIAPQQVEDTTRIIAQKN